VKKPDYKLPATLSEAQREITALRQALTDIDAKAPQACTEESERMEVHHWRGAARDMSRIARAALEPSK